MEEHDERLARPTAGEMKPPPSHGPHDTGADFQEPQSYRAERRHGQRRSPQHTGPKQVKEVVGERVKLEAKRISAEGVAGEPIRREVALEFLDPVLGLSALMVPVKDVLGPPSPVRDDVADVGTVGGVLHHDEDAPGPPPAPRLIAETRKPAPRLSRALKGEARRLPPRLD